MKRLNGVTLIIDAVLILSALLLVAPLVRAVFTAYGFNVTIDSDAERWQGLSDTISAYVANMKFADKERLCKQLSSIYTTAAKSDKDFVSNVEDVRQQTRTLLGFDGVEPIDQEFAFEWQQLFGPDGAIMKWLSDSGTQITDKNQRRFFMAVARGLQQQSKQVKEATILL